MADKPWKRAERLVAATMLEAAGPVEDVGLQQLMSSTGRTGQYYDFQIDALCGSGSLAFAVEVKRRVWPKWFTDAVQQIILRATELKRVPLLSFQFTDQMPVFLGAKGHKVRVDRTWVAAPIDVMAELIQARRLVRDLGLEHRLGEGQ